MRYILLLLILFFLSCNRAPKLPNGTFQGSIRCIYHIDSGSSFYSLVDSHKYSIDSIVTFETVVLEIEIPELLTRKITETYPAKRQVMHADSNFVSYVLYDNAKKNITFIDSCKTKKSTCYSCSVSVPYDWNSFSSQNIFYDSMYSEKQQRDYSDAVNMGQKEYLLSYLKGFINDVFSFHDAYSISIQYMRNDLRLRTSKLKIFNKHEIAFELYEDLPLVDTVTLEFEIQN